MSGPDADLESDFAGWTLPETTLDICIALRVLGPDECWPLDDPNATAM
jgi:hypothetical protein